MKRGDKYFNKRLDGKIGRLFSATWTPPRSYISPLKLISKYISKDTKLLDIGNSISKYRGSTFKYKLCNHHKTLDIDPGVKPDYLGNAQDFVDKFELKNEFDIVMSLGTLEHIEKPQLMVNECYEALKEGGLAIHWTPFIYRVHAKYKDYYRFTDEGLRYLFKDFKKIKIIPTGGFFSILARMFYEATAPLKDIGFIMRVLSYPLFYLMVQLDCLTPQELYCRGYYIIAKK